MKTFAQLLGKAGRLMASKKKPPAGGSLALELGRCCPGTPEMCHLWRCLPALAASRAPLLVVGQEGSGRSVLVEIVHLLNNKHCQRPLFVWSCAQTQSAGGFANALGDRLADNPQGGTLWLADLCRASDTLQRALLAWLESVERCADVRVISTATEALEQRRVTGDFRSDLYYRLNVLHLLLPPPDISSPGHTPPCRSCARGDEEGVVRSALVRARGNLTLAAKSLGIRRATLWRKMIQFGIV